jgi:transposase
MSLQGESLFVALELSNKKWKLAFGDGSKVRQRNIPARSETLLLQEVGRAKEKLGLPADARVVCCYEAGRDGFWVDRMLKRHGFENYVMDPASIEVPRRSRTRKTDRLDAEKLLQLLLRAELWGQRQAFSVVRVPTEQQEAELRVHRERQRLVKERTGHRARLKSLFVLHGLEVGHPATVPADKLRDWEDKPLAGPWVEEVQREQQRLRLVEEQIRHLEKQQDTALEQPPTPAVEKTRKLCRLKAVGRQSGWVLSHECFGWRTFRNRRHLGSFAGLTGTPFDSGETLREQGISKAGSGRVRTTMIELAWGWVRWQPQSALTHWFVDNYVRGGTSRSKRKGIVALARKLLVALWKYVEQDVLPEGAILKAQRGEQPA